MKKILLAVKREILPIILTLVLFLLLVVFNFIKIMEIKSSINDIHRELFSPWGSVIDRIESRLDNIESTLKEMERGVDWNNLDTGHGIIEVELGGINGRLDDIESKLIGISHKLETR